MVVSAYDSEGTDIGTVTSYTLVIPTTSTPTPVPAACSWGLAALAFTTQPVGAGPGEVFTPQPVVAIQDNFGNTVTGATGAVTLSITPGTDTEGATLSGTTTVNAVNGVATFTNLSVDPLVSYYSLTATSPDYTSATSWTLSMTAFGAAPAIGQVGLWVLFGTFSVLFIVLLMRRQGHINEREAR